MFELINQSVRVIDVNLRLEKHGDEDVTACDLKFQAKMSNDVLTELHPDLKRSLESGEKEEFEAWRAKRHES